MVAIIFFILFLTIMSLAKQVRKKQHGNIARINVNSKRRKGKHYSVMKVARKSFLGVVSHGGSNDGDEE